MPATAFNLSVSQADAVIGLLTRAQVPPQPVFYRLLFDYVAGVRSLATERIGEAIAEGPDGCTERLYQEFVAPYELNEPLDQALGKMVARLRVIDGLIIRSAEATNEHSRSLAAAGQHFAGDRLDRNLLSEWVLRLKVNNERMRRAHDALSDELEAAHAELRQTRDEIAALRDGTLRDALTGVWNRAGLDQLLGRVRERRGLAAFSIAVLDVDRFKSLNDSFGHQVGDRVLRVVAKALIMTSGSHMVGRLGGDEFVVLLPGMDIDEAQQAAETIRIAVTTCDLTDALGGQILGEITASLGVAELMADETVAELFERADRLLYRAKQSGRNRVEALIEG